MQRRRKRSQNQIILEQIALGITSFIWTTVVLLIIVFVWIFQDVDSNWNRILGRPDPDAVLAMVVEPTPTHTPWPGPPPSPTPTETLIPSTTPTRVVDAQPPAILPETFNYDEAPPIPVVVHSEEEIGDYVPTPVPVARVQPEDTPTVVVPEVEAPPTEAPVPPTEAPAAPIPPTSTPVPFQPAPAAPTSAPPTPVPETTSNLTVPDRLIIPSVSIDSQVIPVGWQVVEQNGQQYSIWQVADYAVGWHQSSAGLGQPGNMVMAGHHNISGEVFRNLVNVEVGDELEIYAGGEIHRYEIELKTIVKEKGEPPEVRQKNAEWIAPTTDERVTLVTCWPYTNNTHRVIVVAKPL